MMPSETNPSLKAILDACLLAFLRLVDAHLGDSKNVDLDSTKVATKNLRVKKKMIYFINTFSTLNRPFVHMLFCGASVDMY